MNEKFMKALSEGVAILTKAEPTSVTAKNDNDAILELLGTEMRKEVEEILFDNRGNAEYVLGHLNETIERHGFVTVFDLRSYIGGANHPENKEHGWVDLNNARIHVTGGEPYSAGVQKRYRLYLPEAIVLPAPEACKIMTDIRDTHEEKKDNNAILKLLGTEYDMMVRRDTEQREYTVRVSDSKDHHSQITFSELEIISSNRNLLLYYVEQCILAIEEMD